MKSKRKPQRSKRERDYVEHVQQLRRRSGSDTNKSKYNRTTKYASDIYK